MSRISKIITAIEPGLFGCQKLVYRIFDGEEVGRFFDDDIDRRTVVGRIAGTHYHGGAGGTQFDDVGHFPARHARHGVVSQNQIMEGGIEPSQSLAGGIGRIHLVTKVVEKHLGQQPGVDIVVYQQDGS